MATFRRQIVVKFGENFDSETTNFLSFTAREVKDSFSEFEDDFECGLKKVTNICAKYMNDLKVLVE